MTNLKIFTDDKNIWIGTDKNPHAFRVYEVDGSVVIDAAGDGFSVRINGAPMFEVKAQGVNIIGPVSIAGQLRVGSILFDNGTKLP